uniref:alpha-1,2-Mannosidase n=1 Tax=Meloidogyne enterolobii TaxID=390850 RepID=A0A6V7U456_MELEN|nr:unnamed protein product [Meloidogyne enterolobii]
MKNVLVVWLFITIILLTLNGKSHFKFPFASSNFADKFIPVDPEELEIAKEQAKEMFFFGYNNYLKHAFPLDELDPIHCTGRGPDYNNPDNLNINDVLGDYSLTLIDSLNTLVVVGSKDAFHKAVKLVIENVSFEKNVTVQVFEATIRVIGSLLSAHMILTNENPFHGDFTFPEYDSELLTMAHDIAGRLLPAFNGTGTGLPYPRVNLIHGVLPGTSNETCTAGAGSLLLEFGVLSRLLNDPTFEEKARKVNEILWEFRNKETGLMGNIIDIQTGEWKSFMAGMGAGFDSFFEYLLKAHILFGETRELEMFIGMRKSIREQIRRGRPKCRFGDGNPPLYPNVDMRDGSIINTWLDALQASFAGVQVLDGDLDEAICSHAVYYAIWQKYEMIPERFNWHSKTPDVNFYPLRPEFIESTYLLFLATKSPFYQRVGMQIVDSLNLHTRFGCGFATVHNVLDKSLEDRMESFFLSETCKYLYLLFDVSNPLNWHYEKLLFSTEGHTFPIVRSLRRHPVGPVYHDETDTSWSTKPQNFGNGTIYQSCNSLPLPDDEGNIFLTKPLPISPFHLGQYFRVIDTSLDD